MKIKATLLVEVKEKNCILPKFGSDIYSLIAPQLWLNQHVEIDFAQTEIFASPFWNQLVGNLYRDFDEEVILAFVSLINLNSAGRNLFYKAQANNKKHCQLN